MIIIRRIVFLRMFDLRYIEIKEKPTDSDIQCQLILQKLVI